MGTIKNIILVHGFWADASCYRTIIPGLSQMGYEVIAVQNPLTSLADDLAATQRVLDRVNGPSLLVGHSWGGFIITELGLDQRVAGLVYLAALAPDQGESMLDLMSRYGQPSPHFQEQDGSVWISRAGVAEVLAHDLPAEAQDLIYATQAPPASTLIQEKATHVAWEQKPSWYLITEEDRAVSPALQSELAERMQAKKFFLNSGHFPMLSHPKEVIGIIRDASL